MIRVADARDIESIADVHVRSWQAIYRGHMPDSYLDHLSIDRRVQYWTKILSRHSEEVAVFEVPAGIVGFVAVEPSRDDDAEPHTGELTAMYHDPSNWRQGIGRALMGWSVESARTRQWPKMTLWVLDKNAQARSFYEALGWKINGRIRTEAFGGIDLTEVRYVWFSVA